MRTQEDANIHALSGSENVSTLIGRPLGSLSTQPYACTIAGQQKRTAMLDRITNTTNMHSLNPVPHNCV